MIAARGSGERQASVDVLGIKVSSRVCEDLVESLVAASREIKNAYLAFALHVGGLLEADTSQYYVDVMNRADLVYADGAAVSVLAYRKHGRAPRVPTTDLGHKLIEGLSRASGSDLRVALLGGPPGLSQEAGRALQGRHGGIEIAYTGDGYFDDVDKVLAELRDSRPDLIFVGLGAPKEMYWCSDHKGDFPPALVVTCGGWFGFLAGEERRAPVILQRIGLEWVWRLAQAPLRLFKRYSRGAGLVAKRLLFPK